MSGLAVKADLLRAAIAEVEAISDRCINEECYGGEEALIDLLTIRHAIKKLNGGAVGPARQPQEIREGE